MQRRAARITLITILLAVAAAAALFLRNIDQRAAALRAADVDVTARVARLTDALIDLATAQQAYITPGQAGPSWFDRTTTLVRQLYDETAALNGRLRSSDAHATLEGLTAGIDALVAADGRVRENLRLDQPLMAADVIFSDGRNTIDSMMARLRELRQAEAAAVEGEHAALVGQRWMTLGGTALLWLIGAAILIAPRVSRTAAAPPDTQTTADGAALAEPGAGPSPHVDVTAAAALCVDLSRVTSADVLPALFERAANVLDAPGIILWMAAGEQLFAVTAHGYPPQVLARVGPIARRAENATAAAWRDGRTVTVAGVANGNGAIVAPLFGPDACIGVLAVEVRHGRDRDATATAVVTMLAAQLATAVSAWPAASSADRRAQASA